MPTLPLNINMTGKNVLVAGGGSVALRKIRAMLPTGATIRIVSPEPCRELMELADQGILTLRHDRFNSKDLDDTFLVIAATNDHAVNTLIANECRARNIIVCAADAPEQGSCYFPAVLRRGDLEITVSTGGSCPALSAEIRDMLSGIIGEEFKDATRRMAEEREKLLTPGASSTYNRQVLRMLAKELVKGIANRKDML